MAWAPTKLLSWVYFCSSSAFAGPFDALAEFNRVFPPPRVVSDLHSPESSHEDNANPVALDARKPKKLWDAPGPLQDNTEAAAVEQDTSRFLASLKPSVPITQDTTEASSAELRTSTEAAAVEQDASRFLASVKPSVAISDTQSNSPQSLGFHLEDPSAIPQLAPEVRSENLISHDSALPEESGPNCLDARPSRIKDAGTGLFSTCEISAGVRIGEYLGERRMSPSFNHAYEWSVPICSKPHVIVREAGDWAACGAVGKEYIDGAADAGDNPLRFVNGANSPEQRKTLNVFPVFYDGRVFYITSRDIHAGDEFIIDYGEKYWKAHNSLDQYWKVVHRGRLT